MHDNFWEDRTLQTVYRTFSMVRICRVFLIFKLARHYTGLRILVLALKVKDFKIKMYLSSGQSFTKGTVITAYNCRVRIIAHDSHTP